MRIARISFLVLGAATFLAQLRAADPYLLFAGTYTDKGSQGIYAWRFDADSAKAEPLGLVAQTESPSFLALHPNQKVLYAVNETGTFQGQKSGAVSAYSIDTGTGKLTLLNQVSSHGAGPCHVQSDATGKILAVANYDGGNFVTFPLEANGSIGKSFRLISNEGKGPVADRQEGPHGHSVNFAPDNKHMLAVDLGTDAILNSVVDLTAGTLEPGVPAKISTHPGAGPRHLVFSRDGKFAYVINEINSTIAAYSYDADTGALTELQTESTLPAGFHGENTTAEIALHPSGRFLYGSNRGDDSIAIFAVDQNTGKLSPVATVPTGGKTPRNFAFDRKGKVLFAANQDSNNVTIFRVNAKTGKLTPTKTVLEVKSPVCILPLPVK